MAIRPFSPLGNQRDKLSPFALVESSGIRLRLERMGCVRRVQAAGVETPARPREELNDSTKDIANCTGE